MSALLVAVGAAVGAPARFLAGRFLDRSTPWGTLLVNLLGSGLLGWLLGHDIEGDPLALFGVGFCGALTTYSAVAVQSVRLRGWHGVAYGVGTVLACLASAWVAYHLAD